MIARGFIENLANRTAVGSHPAIVIRPAISPDMIPDAFSAAAAEDIAPIPPSPKIESIARPPEASMPARSPDNNKVPPMIQNDVVKRSQSQDASESKDVPPAARIDEKPSVSPAAPADAHAEPSPQKPLSEKKGDKEIMIPDEEAKPPIRPAVTYKAPGQPRPAPSNSKEIPPQQHGKEYDSNAVSPSPAIEAKGSTQQPRAEMAKEEKKDAAVAPPVIIRPEENQMTKEASHAITTPRHDKPSKADFIQQRGPGARPAMQAQSQAGHVQDNTVTINIGRIEVRAVFPQKHGPPAKEQTGVSLSQYLKMRSEGKI